MERIREDRRKRGQTHNMQVTPYMLSGDKKLRISRLEPDLHNGFLSLCRSLPPEVREEFRDHPKSKYDDGLDAIERADWLLSEQEARTVTADVSPW